MSIWNIVHNWVHQVYDSADALYDDARQQIPVFVPIGRGVVPLRGLTDLIFEEPEAAEQDWHAIAVLLGLTNRDQSTFTPTWAQQNQACLNGGGDVSGPIVISNVYRTTIEATSGGQSVVHVVGLRGTASGQQAAAAAAMKTAWEVASGPLAALPSAVTMTQYEATDLSSLTGGIAVVSSTATGGNSGASLATNAACALVKWNGSNRSRSTRGRLYFGPIAEGDVNADGRTLTSARATVFGTAFTNMRNSLSGNNFTLCVISRTLSSATDVTAQAIESVIATQRRRIRG